VSDEEANLLDRVVMFSQCVFGKHEREYLTDEQCESANLFTGIFRPWKCRQCLKEGQAFPIPEMPPMPACKHPLDLKSLIDASLVESEANKARFAHNSKTPDPDGLQPYKNDALLKLINGIEARLKT
jgi:hypothetical protein